MSSIINATTTNGVVIQPDNSGSLVLQTNNGTTAVTVDTSQNTTFAKSIILNGSTSGTVTVAASAVSGTTTLTLPSTSGTVLTSASTIPTSQLSGSISSASLPAGSVLQVVSTTKSDTWSASLPNWADITGMSVSITPTSSTSKIYVMVVLSYTTTGGASNGYRLVRNSTPISIADTAGSRPLFSGMNADGYINTSWIMSSSTNYLDSPATTSAITYKVQAFGTYSGVMYVNYSSADRNASQYDARTVSSITVMEIKG